MNERIRIHATPVQEQNDGISTFNLYHNTLYPEAYAGRYRAILQGNVLVLIHKEYPTVVCRYALSYEIVNNDLRRAWIRTGERAKAHKTIQNLVLLKSLQLVQKINRAR
jgi:hypothetical protein